MSGPTVGRHVALYFIASMTAFPVEYVSTFQRHFPETARVWFLAASRAPDQIHTLRDTTILVEGCQNVSQISLRENNGERKYTYKQTVEQRPGRAFFRVLPRRSFFAYAGAFSNNKTTVWSAAPE